MKSGSYYFGFPKRLQVAREFLEKLVADGPVFAKDAIKIYQGETKLVLLNYLYSAKEELNIVSSRRGNGRWGTKIRHVWRFENQDAAAAKPISEQLKLELREILKPKLLSIQQGAGAVEPSDQKEGAEATIATDNEDPDPSLTAGGGVATSAETKKKPLAGGRPRKMFALCKFCYERLAAGEETRLQIVKLVMEKFPGYDMVESDVTNYARRYANWEGKPWPLPH